LTLARDDTRATADAEHGLSLLARAVLNSDSSLALLKLRYPWNCTYEQQISLEARVVSAIANELHAKGLFNEIPLTGGKTKKGCFVITPHHAQRGAISRLLAKGAETSNVDTVESVQGQEADVVVACYGFGDLDHLVAEKDFIFSRPRLNVSLTRAIKKCIVVCTDAVLRPPSSVLADAAVRDCVTHLRSWQAACQANGASFMVELELPPPHEAAL
jgi:hypothetical protein